MSLNERITLEPGMRRGKPCIRGMRISVSDVLTHSLVRVICKTLDLTNHWTPPFGNMPNSINYNSNKG